MQQQNQDRQNTPAQASDTAKRPNLSAMLDRVLSAPVTPADEIREQEQRAERLRREKLLEALAVSAGQRHAEGARFSTYQAKTDQQRRVVTAVQEWAAGWADRRQEGLALYGPVGTGKDHLAYSACRELVMRHGANIRWVNGRDLAGDIRDRIDSGGSERGLITGLKSADVLVISDPLPPVGDLTQHQADMLYRIVEARWSAGRCTVVTLNVADDDEADRRLGVATWDRLCHGAWKIKCAWASYRKPARVVG